MAGVEQAATSLTLQKILGTGVSYARIGVFSRAEGAYPHVLTNWTMSSDYIITANQKAVVGGATYLINFKNAGTLLPDMHTSAGGGCGVRPWQPASNNGIELNNTPNDPTSGFVNSITGGWYAQTWNFGCVRGGGTDIQEVQLNFSKPNGLSERWSFSSTGTGAIGTPFGNIQVSSSDIRLKKEVSDIPEGALERISAIKPRDFTWKADGRLDRGAIAQELREIDPRYVFEGGGADPHDPILNVSQMAIIADLVGSVQELSRQNKLLREEIEDLKSNTK